jgi:hypothetical protein
VAIRARPLQTRDISKCVEIIAAHPILRHRYECILPDLEPAIVALRPLSEFASRNSCRDSTGELPCLNRVTSSGVAHRLGCSLELTYEIVTHKSGDPGTQQAYRRVINLLEHRSTKRI